MIRLSLAIIFNIIIINLWAQEYNEPWEFLQTTDSITIFVREIPNTEIRELKLTTEFNTSVKKLIETLKQVENMPTWSFTCRTTKLIKKTNNNELFFYYLADIPWPIKGKDVVLHLQFFHDSITGIHTITSNNFDGLVPINNDITRVDYMKAKWKITPINSKQVSVEYYISLKIGNSLPDWIINKAISYSPVKSMNSLKEIIEE